MQMTMTLEDCSTVRADDSPRRTGHADCLGGYHRRKGCLLPGAVLPYRGRLRGRRQASAAGSRSRIDGSDRAASRGSVVLYEDRRTTQNSKPHCTRGATAHSPEPAFSARTPH